MYMYTMYMYVVHMYKCKHLKPKLDITIHVYTAQPHISSLSQLSLVLYHPVNLCLGTQILPEREREREREREKGGEGGWEVGGEN